MVTVGKALEQTTFCCCCK